MIKLIIKSGKGDIALRKSKQWVGLKTTASRDLEQPDYIETQLLQSLGGFQIVSLNKSDSTNEEMLDKERERDEVEVCAHGYYPEDSKSPVVHT